MEELKAEKEETVLKVIEHLSIQNGAMLNLIMGLTNRLESMSVRLASMGEIGWMQVPPQAKEVTTHEPT